MGAAIEFGQKAYFGGPKDHVLLRQDIVFGPRLGLIKHKQDVAGQHPLALPDEQFFDDSAVEMLYALAISVHFDDGIADHRAIERRGKRP